MQQSAIIARRRRVAYEHRKAAFVYIIGCASPNGMLTYVGWTTDLDRRLAQHNAGKGAKFTRGRTWTLLYAERYASAPEAMSREWRLKRDRSFRAQFARSGVTSAHAVVGG